MTNRIEDSIYYTTLGRSHFEKHPIKGVLFDMDGVILDTERLYTHFWVEAGKALGFPMTTEHGLALRSLDHRISQEKFRQWFGPEASHKEIRDKRIELMNAYIEEHGVAAKPGIQEILTYLEKNQIPFCIATASGMDRVDKYLTQIGARHHFKHVITAQDKEIANGKPAPDIYLAAAKALGLSPENCIAVEDSHNGLLSAYRAGAAAIMIPDQDQPNEDMLRIMAAKANSLSDLCDLLSQASKWYKSC